MKKNDAFSRFSVKMLQALSRGPARGEEEGGRGLLGRFSVGILKCLVSRPANSHGSAVSFTIFCHFSRSHDKAPNLTGFVGKVEKSS